MVMMQKGILTLWFLLLTLLHGWSQNQQIWEFNSFQKIDQSIQSIAISPASLDSTRLVEIRKEVSNGVLFNISEEWKKGVLASKPNKLSISLLSPDGEQIELELTRVAGALDRAQIRVASSNLQVDASSSVHYKGKVKNKLGSSAGISILQNEVMGIFFWDGQSYTLGKLKKSDSAEKTHIFYRNNDLLLDFPDICHITEDHHMSAKKPSRPESSSSDNCVHMYFEVTHDIYLDKGDLNSTLDYINGALSQVKILYENEEINWEISEILVWDVPDPYDGPSSGDYLVQFRNELDGNYNGDLAALLGYGGGGGVAYVDVLCNNYWGVSYSGIGSSYNDVPQYSWTIMVISHEIGHNIGSPHTHACFWNGDDTMIDGCGGSNQNCPLGPIPPSGGTIMSYCHGNSVGIDLGEGFHPQVVDLFEDEIGNASCLGPCESTIPTSDFGVVETQLCTGSSVQFYSLASQNTTEWNWIFPGGSPSSSTEENPIVTYENSGTYDAILEVASSAGQTDELVKADYISVDNNGSEVKIYQDFENGMGDYVTNSSSGVGFEITSNGSGSTYGLSSLWLDNYNNSNGSFDDLKSPLFSLLSYNSATLFIDYAVTRRNNVSDSLVIYASRDGGSTFEHVAGFFEDGSGTYSTHLNTNDEFIPQTGEHWCLSGPGNACLEIDLSSFAREDNVQLLIRNKHFGGNNLFIDRLWVQTDCYDLDAPNADFSANFIEGCAGMVVDFTDLSTEFPQSHDWIFDGGVPNNSSDPNPTIIYDEPGEYAVTLSVSNPEGTDTETKIGYITVGEEPTADFEFDVSERTVEFSYIGERGETFDWTFGDGNGSTEENPTHTYLEGGEYIVELTVANACGTATSELLVVLSTLPMAEIDISSTQVCVSSMVFFDANGSSNADEYYWEFEGGSPSTSTNDTVNVTYSEAGHYDVTLIASNENGDDTIYYENYISVDTIPFAEFSALIDDLTASFQNLSQDYTDVLWDFGDGNTSSSENPVHEYAQEGVYEVELLAINQCDTSNFSLSIEVFTLPTSDFSASVTEGCADLVVKFQNSSTENALDFQWFFPGADPEVSFEENPEVIYFAPGLHPVTLIVSNPSGSDTLVIEEFINIYPSPQPFFDYVVDSLTISFEDLSNYVDRYYWDFGDGESDTIAQPSHTYDVDSSYEITLMGMNDCDTVWITRTVGTEGLPQANFKVLGERLGCVPMTVELNNETAGDGIEYQWIFPGGSPDSSDAANPSVTYDSAGIYPITLIAYNDNGSNQFTLQNAIHVIELPSSSFIASSQSDYTYDFESEIEGEEISNIQWFFGDGSGSSEENPSHTFGADGVYDVMLVVSNFCGNDTSKQTLQIQTTSVTSFEEESIQVYPNPANERVYISPWPVEARIEIHNSLGSIKEIWRPSITDQYLSVNRLPGGMYFIHIIRDRDRIIAPLIIQR